MAIEVAHQVLIERGAEGLNLREIAQRCGVAVASLYNHFADKDELLVELAVEGFQAFEQDIVSGSAAGLAAEAHVRFKRNNAAVYGLMYSERLIAGSDIARAAEAKAFAAYSARLGSSADEAFGNWALSRGLASLSCLYPDAVES